MKMARLAYPRGLESAEVVQVIKTVTTAGTGTEKDPNRYVTSYWSLDGELLAINDPQSFSQTP